jgi:anti-anti-sigma factor
MPLLAAPRWTMDVERGPDWLFLRLHAPDRDVDLNDLAETVWNTMQQHFAKRVVLELDDVKFLHSRIIGQLVLLHKRICASSGTMRVSGLNESNQAALRATRLSDHFPCYHSREEALMGRRPTMPR